MYGDIISLSIFIEFLFTCNLFIFIKIVKFLHLFLYKLIYFLHQLFKNH